MNQIIRRLLSRDWTFISALAVCAAALVWLYTWASNEIPASGIQGAQGLVVCIDPGHPTSYNSGRGVVNGLRELDINWEVALKLEKLLVEDYGVQVVMTRRDKEALMENWERAQVSNNANAALFLRLHCDAGPNSGFTLYYPDRQGKSVGVEGPSPEIIEQSRHAAEKVHEGMAAVLEGQLNDRGVKGERYTKVGRIQGALTGSILSKAPVVTVEMAFLTNRSDAQFIGSELGQNIMARALAEGVMNYLGSKR